ncbi:uncharacterized protein [Atheta coriaria]|uniref:uncharacterized protein n=1 Tax=Dalotia coriaria TaxID=877792 RepID=UPI0031F431A4
MFLKFVVFAVAVSAVAANNAESSFHMKFEKCELANYNKEWIKDMVITCTILNETHFKVDGSGHLLKDMNFDDVVATGQIYVWDKDDYVIKPHLKMTMKSCDEYSAERFGYWKEIENHGNLKGCGVHKADFYSVKDYIPRMKIKDVTLQKESRIKLSVKLALDSAELLDLLFFVGIAPK